MIFQYIRNEVFSLLGETGKKSLCHRISTGSIFTKKKSCHTKDYFIKIITHLPVRLEAINSLINVGQ